MLRRCMPLRQTLNKGAQNPGPTLHGWGRSIQKRRLEYESVESKYHKKEFNKNWDLAGGTQRSTDHLAMRVYFNYPMAAFTWCFNMFCGSLWTFIPGMSLLYFYDEIVWAWDARIKRAAWW